MKALKFLLFLFFFVFVACEKNKNSSQTDQSDVPPVVYERTVWVNEDVECCGVKDPLNNLGWLKEASEFDEYKTILQSCSKYLLLYKNNTTQENIIVISSENEKATHVLRLNCNGDKMCDHIIWEKTNVSMTECFICMKFYETHTEIDTVAYYIVKPKK